MQMCNVSCLIYWPHKNLGEVIVSCLHKFQVQHTGARFSIRMNENHGSTVKYLDRYSLTANGAKNSTIQIYSMSV